jgi:hypothetical protein
VDAKWDRDAKHSEAELVARIRELETALGAMARQCMDLEESLKKMNDAKIAANLGKKLPKRNLLPAAQFGLEARSDGNKRRYTSAGTRHSRFDSKPPIDRS